MKHSFGLYDTLCSLRAVSSPCVVVKHLNILWYVYVNCLIKCYLNICYSVEDASCSQIALKRILSVIIVFTND